MAALELARDAVGLTARDIEAIGTVEVNASSARLAAAVAANLEDAAVGEVYERLRGIAEALECRRKCVVMSSRRDAPVADYAQFIALGVSGATRDTIAAGLGATARNALVLLSALNAAVDAVLDDNYRIKDSDNAAMERALMAAQTCAAALDVLVSDVPRLDSDSAAERATERLARASESLAGALDTTDFGLRVVASAADPLQIARNAFSYAFGTPTKALFATAISVAGSIVYRFYQVALAEEELYRRYNPVSDMIQDAAAVTGLLTVSSLVEYEALPEVNRRFIGAIIEEPIEAESGVLGLFGPRTLAPRVIPPTYMQERRDFKAYYLSLPRRVLPESVVPIVSILLIVFILSVYRGTLERGFGELRARVMTFADRLRGPEQPAALPAPPARRPPARGRRTPPRTPPRRRTQPRTPALEPAGEPQVADKPLTRRDRRARARSPARYVR